MKGFLLGILLASQIVLPPTIDELELEQAERRAWPGGSNHVMFTVIAQFADGEPARGYINCNGIWCKYGGGEPAPNQTEPDRCAQNLPFRTDSRGACVFNPQSYWLSSEDDNPVYMTCYATSGTRSGKLTFVPYNGGIFRITIPGRAQ